MTRRTRAGLAVLFALVVLAAPVAPAAAQSREERKREQVIERLAKKLGVDAGELAAVGAERYVARDAAARKAVLADLGRRPRGSLVPLVVDAALEDGDFENRRSAVKLLSVVGLDGDRSLFLGSILPALPRLFADKSELIWQDAADELNRFVRLFACDAEVAPLLERSFKGANLRLAQRAFQGLLLLENPELRQDLVLRAVVEVIHPKARFGVFDRKRGILAIPEHREAATPQALAALMLEDGTIAVEIAQVLGELGDRQVLGQLRRIDRTASHKLRIPAYDARGLLSDELLVQELLPALESDHPNIQKALLEALGWVNDPKVDVALARLAQTVTDATLRRTIALARLRRGDAGDEALLRAALEGAGDAGLARDVLDVEHAAAIPLLVVIAKNGDDAMAGPRGRAIDLLGERGLDTPANRELLTKLQKGDPSALRLRAAASLVQLGAPDGVAAVTSALIGLDVVSREDVLTDACIARRFSGSPLLDVMARWGRARTVAAAPLLARWLDPPPVAAPAPGPAAPAGGTSERRDPPPGPVAPTPPAFLSHQLVRREAVAALGELAVALAERLRTAPDEAKPALATDLREATVALGVRLDDPAGVVRNAAVRALARLSGQDALAPGAALATEEEVRAKMRVWLAAQAR